MHPGNSPEPQPGMAAGGRYQEPHMDIFPHGLHFYLVGEPLEQGTDLELKVDSYVEVPLLALQTTKIRSKGRVPVCHLVQGQRSFRRQSRRYAERRRRWL